MAKAKTMADLLEDSDLKQLKKGEVVEGSVLTAEKHEVWIDLGPHGVGVVSRREIGHGNRDLEKGEEVVVSVLEPEIEDGSVLLSLRKAAKDKGWEVLQKAYEAEETIQVESYDANRGGLLIEAEGIRGFLPVSQLSAEHYPRVSGADKDEILQKLNKLKGIELDVQILDIDRKQNKLIFSEKAAIRDAMQDRLKELTEGDVVTGTVTGVVDFGAFINVNGIEGLIHISEISWDRVEDPNDYMKVGEEVEAKVIKIDDDRLSLSLKQTKDDPWLEEVKEYKVGSEVEGTVTRITPFGAFIQISSAVEALVHISELGESDDTSDPEKLFKLNETKTFTIINIDKDSRKISLSFDA
jgi:small subunit ribosomal protein S1